MKVDLKRTLPCYRGTREPQVLDVPDLRYLMIDGHGDPNGEVYRAAVETLFPVAYRLKMASKKAGRDFVVMPLEALWWSDDWADFTTARDKSRWSWTLMVLQPEWITAEPEPPVRLETLSEGRCVQALHIGPYDDEGPLLERMHAGHELRGKHHEIYLSDVRRTAPEKLRTILRQPV
jgi:hypothetical protein